MKSKYFYFVSLKRLGVRHRIGNLVQYILQIFDSVIGIISLGFVHSALVMWWLRARYQVKLINQRK
jgi:hypothetical protein